HYAEPALVGDPEQVHKLTGISNIVGTVETRFANFKYDNQGRATSSTVFGPPNEVASVTYDSNTQATMTTESGAVTTYTMGTGTYRPITNMSTSGVSGSVSRLYDSQKRVMSETDRRGITTSFTYPTEYNRTITSAVGTPEQRRREVDRNASNLTTQVRVFDNNNVLQSKTSWTYNTRGQVLTETLTNVLDNNTRTNTKIYCEDSDVTSGTCPIVGLLLSENNSGSGDTTSYTYRQTDEESCATAPTTCPYRKGDLWKVTNSLNHISEIVSYDGSGRILAIKNYNGVVTEFEYDFKGRQSAIKIKGSDGDRTTTMTYTSTNQVKQVNNPDGTYLKYNYDDADRLTSMEDNLGNKTVYTLNADGKTLKEEIKDSGGIPRKTLAFTYNSLSQMMTVRDAQSQLGGNATATMTYDSEGNLETTTDALSRQSTNEYDSLGRIKKFIKDAAGLLPQEVNQKHNALNSITKVIDPKNLDTNYLYDGFGKSSKLESKDTGNTDYKYNSLGQLTEAKDANGKTTQYVYDILGRTRIIDYAESPTPGLDITYTYDELPLECERGEGYVIGKLTKVEDGSGSTALCYNAYGDLVRKVQKINGKTFVLRWIYKVNGQLEQMIYPDGLVVDYVYNSLGQVSEVGVTSGSRAVLIEDATYYPFGPIAGWDYGNGRSITRTFDLNYRPHIIRDTASGGINYTYAFNGVGNLTQLQAPGLIRDYKYDGLNRLKSAENSSQIKLWEYNYDATGNRTSVIEAVPNGSSYNYLTKNYAYDTNSHRLTYDGTEYKAYDLAGNLTKTSATVSGPAILSLSYNSANRLHSVTKSTGSVQYVYNASGERVQRTPSAGGETYFVYGDSGSLLGEYNSSGSPIKQMIWLAGMPVGLVTGTTSTAKLYYVQSDALGTPRTVIDPVRNLSVWKNPLENEAFGKVQPITDPDADGTHFEFNLRFPGQIHDSFTGLVYNYFRDYDPSTGRYVQSDPIGLAGGISTYSYVGANPLTATDPLGLQAAPNRVPNGVRGLPPAANDPVFLRTVPTGTPGTVRIPSGISRAAGFLRWLGPAGKLVDAAEYGWKGGTLLREALDTDKIIDKLIWDSWWDPDTGECKDDEEDPCPKIEAELERLEREIEGTIQDGLYSGSGPRLTPAEEMANAKKYYELQAKLRKLLELAKKHGCRISWETGVSGWANIEYPYGGGWAGY
ncbi:MAG: RHS repeat-associated core domain-containing protein, partial [Bdellovibrionota bacterium]